MPVSDGQRGAARAPARVSCASIADRSHSDCRSRPLTVRRSSGCILCATVMFATLQDLVQGTRDVLDLNGGVRVKDPAALRGQTIDRLIHTAVFASGDLRDATRWVIWEAGWELGIKSA